jgi:hypothetical protein
MTLDDARRYIEHRLSNGVLNPRTLIPAASPCGSVKVMGHGDDDDRLGRGLGGGGMAIDHARIRDAGGQ